ncbi:protein of unknown function [Candidatus Filomicrobium marinum]|uniref:Uncharacterized protein n=1 Tax=Candidatus Filomicrobium marinum TaxID=1608628 RepID=A0A0D6JEB5_9HYPH|nr:protein of unknown function [Candidatus Filomicrobium marinum]CPR17725.1 protein of unknown function [Candidatus Filomicrobium marinum]
MPPVLMTAYIELSLYLFAGSFRVRLGFRALWRHRIALNYQANLADLIRISGPEKKNRWRGPRAAPLARIG